MPQSCVTPQQLEDARFNAAIAAYPPLVNIGSGSDQTVRELAELVARVVGFKGALRFDTSKPDGMPRKLPDSSRIARLGWAPKVSREEGIALAHRDLEGHLQTQTTN